MKRLEKNMATKVSQRQSNIELLRIFAMVMIVAHHLGVHSEYDLNCNMIIINKLWIQFIQMGGKVGVNIFVLISGYFLITTQTLKLSKVLKMWLQMLVHALVLFLLLVLLGKEEFNLGDLLGCFVPMICSGWWFANTYFILFLLSPFINTGLRAMGKRTYQRFLLLLLVCWCVVPTIMGNYLESNALLWFIFLYALAGYLRLHVDVTVLKSGVWKAIALYITVATFLLASVLDGLGVDSALDPYSSGYFYGMQQLPILLTSVCWFVGFLSSKVEYSPVINVISSATFGVYLIHDYGTMRQLLWQDLFNNDLYTNSPWMIPYTILQIIVVFAACAGIELLRIYLIEKRYISKLEPASKSIIGGANSFLKKLFFRKQEQTDISCN
jgi:surface polysaccharide O-acyltransferase-like enzyme